MSLPTPYDGSSRLFQIGLKPLDPAEWIDARPAGRPYQNLTCGASVAPASASKYSRGSPIPKILAVRL